MELARSLHGGILLQYLRGGDVEPSVSPGRLDVTGLEGRNNYLCIKGLSKYNRNMIMFLLGKPGMRFA